MNDNSNCNVSEGIGSGPIRQQSSNATPTSLSQEHQIFQESQLSDDDNLPPKQIVHDKNLQNYFMLQETSSVIIFIPGQNTSLEQVRNISLINKRRTTWKFWISIVLILYFLFWNSLVW